MMVPVERLNCKPSQHPRLYSALCKELPAWLLAPPSKEELGSRFGRADRCKGGQLPEPGREAKGAVCKAETSCQPAMETLLEKVDGWLWCFFSKRQLNFIVFL